MDDSKQFIGTTFDGRYKIERVVGIGGMAFVYEATDEQTGGKVALKLLKEKFSDDTRAVKRFINESKSLELLNHTNIVKIHDISVQTKYKYIVMEYINGITLRKYMNYKRPLDWREAVEFTDQIAQALDNAHTMGIIHRDIKPSNLYYPEGRPDLVAIMDFGIVREEDSSFTSGVPPCTFDYAPPEIATTTDKGSPGMDIFALGLSLRGVDRQDRISSHTKRYARTEDVHRALHIHACAEVFRFKGTGGSRTAGSPAPDDRS